MNILQKHTQIYSKEIPKFLFPFFEAPSIKRLHGIGQHCGTEYTQFFHYKFHPSRFEHSLGVALIVRHFTKSQKQTLAGFFHDISNSVFSHVGDFMMGDKIKQESTEELTSEIIANDTIIQRELGLLGLSTQDVDDYAKYPIADNPGPQLSSDRLEYTLTGGYNLGHISLEEMEILYKDITVMKNEYGEEELGFINPDLAGEFALLSIKNDQECFSSYKSNISMSFLGEILKRMIEKKLLTLQEMFKLQEQDIIEKIQQSNDVTLIDAWNFFTHLNRLNVSKEFPSGNVFCIDSKNKKRYIDPLIKNGGNAKRASHMFPELQKRIQAHKNYPLEWISIDYQL